MPTMFVRMLKLPEEETRHAIRSLQPSAAPCTPPLPAGVEVKRRMIEWWGPMLHEYYAGTEGNGFVTCIDSADLAGAGRGSVGKALLTARLHICRRGRRRAKSRATDGDSSTSSRRRCALRVPQRPREDRRLAES